MPNFLQNFLNILLLGRTVIVFTCINTVFVVTRLLF